MNNDINHQATTERTQMLLGGGGKSMSVTISRNNSIEAERTNSNIIHKIRNGKTLEHEELIYINNLSLDDRIIILQHWNSMASYYRDLIDTF